MVNLPKKSLHSAWYCYISHQIPQRTRIGAYCGEKHKSQELHDYDDRVIGRRLRLAHSQGRPAHERPYYRWQSPAYC
ncbi:Ankyrin repeat and death domain-containing protein 1A [Fusarium oxysporum f. sp. albedinis]|nr:Ankyrin repeat and death domain-containing protein 1A [Fusarium oxysporum f. sp. albedinis]